MIQAIVPIHQREVAAPPQPRLLIVQRWDREAPESVSEGEVHFGADLIMEGSGATLAWMLTVSEPHGYRCKPYVRKSPNSPWGVRVEILGEGR